MTTLKLLEAEYKTADVRLGIFTGRFMKVQIKADAARWKMNQQRLKVTRLRLAIEQLKAEV